MFIGLGMGLLFFTMLTSYSLGFWFGSHCVEDTGVCPARLNNGNTYTAGDVIIVFFTILMAGFNFTQLTPAIKKVAEGRVAAFRIFQIIDRKPEICSPEEAVIPTTF